MTVAQLIEALQQMPPHHFVTVAQRSYMGECGMVDPSECAGAVELVEPAGQGVVLIVAE